MAKKAQEKTAEIIPVTVDTKDVKSLIHVIRGKQVMLDSDLAMLYQVETKVFNQSVTRNIERFPENFRFQLTKEEYDVTECNLKRKRRQTISSICFHRTGNSHAFWSPSERCGCSGFNPNHEYIC